MKLDSLLNEKISGELALTTEQLDLEQALIHKKDKHNAYSVERAYINSKSYHDKFENFPVNKEVQQSLYREAGRLLNFVDGQEQERMLVINARTGEFVVDNFDRDGDMYKTGFNGEEYQKILDCPDNIIVMHNHSLNGRPSAQDLISYLKEEKVKLSLILCHDGSVYGIFDVQPEVEAIYEMYLNEVKTKTTSVEEAKRLATTKLYILNDKLGKKQKLFDVRRF